MDLPSCWKQLPLLFSLCSPLLSHALDSDNDGVSDAIEIKYGFDANFVHSRPYITHEARPKLYGGAAGDLFGFSVSNAGDVNNDGFDDVIIGAPRANAQTGSAYIYSGKDNSELHRFNGMNVDDEFGWSVAAVGDINKDGYDDVVIGIRRISASGSIQVRSGLNGQILFEAFGDQTNDMFAQSVALAGDVNNDGYSDVIVGVPGHHAGGYQRGQVKVYSGKTGTLLFNLNGMVDQARIGISVSGVGDFNSDNYDDIIISGYTANDNTGYVQIISGINQVSLLTLNGKQSNDLFGQVVVGMGDINGDNKVDFGVSSRLADTRGRFEVYSTDGTLLFSETGSVDTPLYANAIANVGDISGDGINDLMVSKDHTTNGRAELYSGKAGQLTEVYVGEVYNSFFAGSFSSAGDLNNDGITDFIIGSPYDYLNGDNVNKQGSASIYLSVVRDDAGNVLHGHASSLDSDNDGLTDEEENSLGTNPNLADTDSDGLSDDIEVNTHHTNPLLADTDSDGLNDGVEVNAGSDPLVDSSEAADYDSDGDGIPDLLETSQYQTNPNWIDSDFDGVNDGDEIALGTNPNLIEQHRLYGFEDGLAASGLLTDTSLTAIGWEVDANQASQGSFSLKAQAVNQGQLAHIGLWANFAAGVNLTFDVKTSSTYGQDGLAVFVGTTEVGRWGGETNWQSISISVPEGLHSISFIYGQNGNSPSGDNTAWVDNIRITQSQYGQNADMDLDGIPDNQEYLYETILWIADTDGDGFNDATEINEATDPTDASSYPGSEESPDGSETDNGGNSSNGGVGDGSSGSSDDATCASDSKLCADGSSGGGSLGFLVLLVLMLAGMRRRV